ncbi:MAG: PAS domain S-box protein [Sporomusaceae bacterium]|nr:PAS domain S-box protein [Sporomusaceae bacterium]
MGYCEYLNVKEYTDIHQGLIDCKSIETVKESQCILQATLNAIVDGIIIMDCKQNIYHYNDKLIEMWNINDSIFADKDQPDIIALILKNLKNPEEYIEKERVLCTQPEKESCDVFTLKDGRIFERYSKPQWLDGQAVGRVLTFRDITGYRKSESAAQQSEEKFRMLLNNQNDGILLLNIDENGIAENFIEANNLACKWLGCTRDELLAMSPENIGDMMPAVSTALYNNQNNREDNEFLYKTVYFTSKDSQIQLEMDVHSFELNGHKVGLYIARDIAERKRLQNKMAHLERLNLVGEMAAGISHEVRNPMTTIRGFLQVLMNKKECSKYLEYYKLMIEELDRANAIITEFLSLANERLSCRRLQNMNEIVKSLRPLIEADAIVANKYIKVELAEIPELLLDEKEIRQLILNLVRNGLDAMSPGDYLLIRTSMEGDKVVLSIKDQGMGIDPKVIEKIGTPFFTTKEQGTGLGLAICYRIAVRHHAAINVESSNKGTTFFIKFNKTSSLASSH